MDSDKEIKRIPLDRFPDKLRSELYDLVWSFRTDERLHRNTGKPFLRDERLDHYEEALQEWVMPACFYSEEMQRECRRAVPELFEDYPPFLDRDELMEYYEWNIWSEEVSLSELPGLFYEVHVRYIVDLFLDHIRNSTALVVTLEYTDTTLQVFQIQSPLEDESLGPRLL